jgi:hypothetical protein
LQNKVLTVLDPAIRSRTADNTSTLITSSKLIADAARGCCANSQSGLSAKPGCYPRIRANADTGHACTDTPDASSDTARNSSNAGRNAPDSGSDATRNSTNTSRSSKRNAASRDPADPQYFSDDGHSNHRTLFPSLKRTI